jgi:hypothetical protein
VCGGQCRKLPVSIARIHYITIYYRHLPYSCPCNELCAIRTNAAKAYHQHLCLRKFIETLFTHQQRRT